jgi:hypothetical protein
VTTLPALDHHLPLELARVTRECDRWGVPVHFAAPPDGAESLLSAPQHMAWIQWPQRVIWFDDIDNDVAALGLLHELTHCVVGAHPSTVDEIYSGMLYLEWVTQRRLKLSRWSKWMEDYSLGGDRGDEWGDVSVRDKSRELAKSKQGAIKAGIVDHCGKPTYRKAPVTQ